MKVSIRSEGPSSPLNVQHTSYHAKLGQYVVMELSTLHTEANWLRQYVERVVSKLVKDIDLILLSTVELKYLSNRMTKQ